MGSLHYKSNITFILNYVSFYHISCYKTALERRWVGDTHALKTALKWRVSSLGERKEGERKGSTERPRGVRDTEMQRDRERDGRGLRREEESKEEGEERKTT